MIDKTNLLNVRRFLKSNRLATLATVSSDKIAPQASFIYYVVLEDHDIYFATAKDSRKVINILKNKNVALVIAHEVDPVELQIEGQAEVSRDLVFNTDVLQQYLEVANANMKTTNFPPITQLAPEGFDYIKITCEWFKYSDFSGHPASVIEGTLADLKS